MEDDLITTKEVGDYRIKVYYCHDTECPVTNWGLFGSFFFEYSDTHRLHDECNWKIFFYDNKHDLRDVIDAIVMKHIEQKDILKYLKKGEANGISFTYNRGSNVWELKHKTSPYIGQEFSPSDLTDFDCRGELIEDLNDEDLLDIISKYGKDVVTIEWSTRGYNQGDYIKGIAYVTKEKYDNEVCNKEGDWKEDCAKIISEEVPIWTSVCSEDKSKYVRLATEEEKKSFAERIANTENLKKAGIIKQYLSEYEYLLTKEKKCDFKPFDQVLVRASNLGNWNLHLFARVREEEYKYECLGGLRYKECIPYQGNEHLLGTTENPEK